jgi:small subunit ribosomal protein S1
MNLYVVGIRYPGEVVIAEDFPNVKLSDAEQSGAADATGFAELLDEYAYDAPHRGQILEGIVLEVRQDEILVDVGLKRDALVTRRDISLLDDDIRQKITVGQEVLTYVLQPSNEYGELIVSINKALELEDWRQAEELKAESAVIEAEVIGSNRGGVLVRFDRLTGFVPQSHIISLPRFTSDEELIHAKKDLIGQQLPLKFIEIDRQRNRLILSERDARAEARESRMSELHEGQQITGRVVSIVDFGVFVDIGGVDGLIHISKLDHRHVHHPGEVLAVGDEVEVLVDSIDEADHRISLNRAALLPDPWNTVEQEYSVGDLIQGVVTNVVDFGAFVQLPNGLQGLVHVSRMSTFGVSSPRDLLRERDTVLARIGSIEPDRQRIGLSMDDVSVEEQETWMYNRQVLEPGSEEVLEDDSIAEELEVDE